MSRRPRGLSGTPAGSVLNVVCPAAREAGCSLRTAALDATPGKNGLKESTECETEIFLSLAPGHHIAVRDHETGALWGGWVDMTFPERGIVWVITDLGERKLLDMERHTVWRADQSEPCGSVLREGG